MSKKTTRGDDNNTIGMPSIEVAFENPEETVEAAIEVKTDFSWSFLIWATTIIYLGMICVVLMKPEIMVWLGLENFVQYLIHVAQPSGYRNLVQLNSKSFANYFYNFHAASMIICGSSSVLIVALLIGGSCFDSFRKLIYSKIFANLTYKLSLSKYALGRWLSNPAVGASFGLVAIVAWCWFQISIPILIDTGSRLSPTRLGIGMSILLWVNYNLWFVSSVLLIYRLIAYHWWPSVFSKKSLESP